MEDVQYGGFWLRTGAAIIDSLLLLIIIMPVLTNIYGYEYWLGEQLVSGSWDVLLNCIFPAIVVLVFWSYKSATPGKMGTKLTIVDATSGEKPTTQQFIIRYIGYYLATIPLGIGILWVAFDKRKQGWHDKMANTVVLRELPSEAVHFDG